MPALPCRYTAYTLQLLKLGLTPVVSQPCDDEATHLASVQARREGLVITVAVHVCVWHAEAVRQGAPGLITLPHTPLMAAFP